MTQPPPAPDEPLPDKSLPSKPAPGEPPPAGPPQARNPLHGVTLEQVVTALQQAYGWAGLAERVPLRCFSQDPSLTSSLKLLRKTPWARAKVESLYLFMLRDAQRQVQRQVRGQPGSDTTTGPDSTSTIQSCAAARRSGTR